MAAVVWPSWASCVHILGHSQERLFTSSSRKQLQVKRMSLFQKMRRNEVTCLWFHSPWVVALLIASPRFFPCCLPLQIRCQKNLGLKIHWLTPVTGRDCVCFMETGSVSFSIATVRVWDQKNSFEREAKFFQFWQEVWRNRSDCMNQTQEFFCIRGVCRQRTQKSETRSSKDS